MMLNVENTPRTVENIRSTSVAMRKLPVLSTVEHDEMLIAFCFGLLSVSFATFWKDACNVLKAIVDRSGSKIWEFAFSRLASEELFSNVALKDDAVLPSPETSQPLQLADDLWSNSQSEPTPRLESLYDKVF
jgi:hypothetical protein